MGLSGNNRLLTLGVLAGGVASVVIAALVGLSGAQIVMTFIGYIAFLTVVAVIVVGARGHEPHPGSASESPAVQAWQERARAGSQPQEASSES